MVFAALMLCSAVLPVGTFQSSGCEPHGHVKFICGVVSPEDLVAVPRSDWVIASGYAAGGVHLVNTRDYATTQVFPVANPRERLDKKTYASCPGPIDPAEKEKFSAHGLAVRQGQGRVHTVYLVHHGFRESVEVFEIDTQPKVPTFTWVGCVVAPETVGLNSVTPVPGGGFAATNPNRRGTPAASQGTNTGEVWDGNAKDGWKIVPGSESQGPNGIEVSPDGKWFYINLWPARKVMRLSRGQTPVSKEVVDVSFQPDNIRWQADGSLLAAGHGGPSIQRVIECLRKVCPDATSNVARIDPQTLKVQQIITYPANERFFSSTAALQVGKEIWIGTITGDRIARYPIQ
jgi:hypothetical protein